MGMVNSGQQDPFYLTYNGMGQDLIDNVTETMSAKYGEQFTTTTYNMFDLKNPDCHTQTYKLNFKKVNTNNLKEWVPGPTFIVNNVGTAQGPVPTP
jgi:hypothetical protein